MTKIDFSVKQIKKITAGLMVICVLFSFFFAGGIGLWAEDVPDEGTESATPGYNEDETPEPGDETEEPTEEPTPTPTPTPVPEYADDGSRYLRCDGRDEISLDGTWRADTRSYDDAKKYSGEPLTGGKSFEVPGIGYEGAEALLLTRTFYITAFDEESSSVLLSTGKMMYGARIFINGEFVAMRPFSYITEKIDISEFVVEGENTISIMLISGENSVYKAGRGLGIDNSVTIESRHGFSIGEIFIDPVNENGVAKMRVELDVEEGYIGETTLEVNVFELGLFENGEAAIHNGVGTDSVRVAMDGTGGRMEVSLTVRLRGFEDGKCWSPDNPFLYQADFNVDGMSKSVVFGVRSVTVNEDEVFISLNGQPVFLSGVTIDYSLISELGIWSETSARQFIGYVKGLGLNTIKGKGVVFSPMWYKICDEEGVLLLSEFPLGTEIKGEKTETNAGAFTNDILAVARTLYNYASCVVWDLAGEEEVVQNLANAISEIKALDAYARPFSTGLREPGESGYMVECDVTLLGGSVYLGDLSLEAPLLQTTKEIDWNVKNVSAARIITNFFGNIITERTDVERITQGNKWWGDTLLALGTEDGAEGFDKVMRVLIEYWRTSRKYGGIILPVEVVRAGLGGKDSFFREGFSEAVRNAFSPIGVNIESYSATGGRGDYLAVDVAVTNNLPEDLGTIEVVFTLSADQKILYQETKQYESIKKYGTAGRDIARREFSFTVPSSIVDGTELVITATVSAPGVEAVSSVRNAFIEGGNTYESPYSATAVFIAVATAAAAILVAVAASLFRVRAFNVRQRKQEKK